MANFNISGGRIDVTGLGLGDYQPVILFPSGQFSPDEPGSDLEAILIQLNASFGFNTTPHNFSSTWVPIRENPLNFHGASGQAPEVGKIIGFTVGDFLASGEVIHSDYSVDANGGTIVSVSMRDTRRCLDKITIVTEDLGNNPGSGMISVARAVRIVDGFEDIYGNISEEKFKEYRKVLEQGCTYPQILNAIQLAIDSGEVDFNITSIPTQEELEANLGGTASAIRFNFQSTPLTEVLTNILQATSYDWYWSMSENKVKLINRKYGFDLQENNLLDQIAQLGAASGLEQTVRLSFGDDFVTQPRKVTLLGAHQEGWVNSEILSTLDGLDTQASGITFYPAWGNISVQFTDAYGILRSYKPLDLELQAAIKGIEYWTYFKKYQSIPTIPSDDNPEVSGFGLPSDAGSIAAQHPDFQSRLDPAQPIASIGGNEQNSIRLINNRRDIDQNWVINFYNRVENHANTYFGKAYLASGILANAVSGAYRLADSAWGNIENQIEGQSISVSGSSGLFVNDYQINSDLGVFSPFKGTDDKIIAHCILPNTTKYGPDGEDSPAGFGQWTEDYFFPIDPITGEVQNQGSVTSVSGKRPRTGEHYIPVSLSEVGGLSIDPRAPLAAFEEYPEGTVLCQLPIIAGDLENNDILGNLATVAENSLESNSLTLEDITNPGLLIKPYDSLTKVAVPVQATYRYGMSYPQQWASGSLVTECDNEVLVIDDQFAPWNFPPQGTQTSIQIMEDRALRRLQGLIAPAATSKYAEVELVGLPKISFDAFSNSEPDISGRIGIRNHGITSINFSLGSNGITSNYKIASFFASFGEDAPLGEKQRAILNGIINPIDFDRPNPLAGGGRNPGRPSPPITFGNAARRGEVSRKVIIEEVNNVLSFSSTPLQGTQERYRGRNSQGYDSPPVRAGSSDDDLKGTGGAICVDGFLNVDDEAIYHVNEVYLPVGGLQVQRYFTGGRSFSNGTVVFVSGVGSSAGLYDVAIEGTNPLRKLVDVPILNGTISIGSLTTLVSRADSSTPRVLSRPGASLTKDGVYINPGGGGTPSVPVGVISVSSPGTTSATVDVQTLQADGTVDPSGTTSTNITPVPFRQFVTSGDIGLLVTDDVGNNFFVGNRQNFIRFS